MAVLKPLPAIQLFADTQVTPVPLTQFEKVTPAGGVVQIAVGTAGQVTVPPPPTTTVCPLVILAKTNKVKNTTPNFFKTEKFESNKPLFLLINAIK